MRRGRNHLDEVDPLPEVAELSDRDMLKSSELTVLAQKDLGNGRKAIEVRVGAQPRNFSTFAELSAFVERQNRKEWDR